MVPCNVLQGMWQACTLLFSQLPQVRSQCNIAREGAADVPLHMHRLVIGLAMPQFLAFPPDFAAVGWVCVGELIHALQRYLLPDRALSQNIAISFYGRQLMLEHPAQRQGALQPVGLNQGNPLISPNFCSR